MLCCASTLASEDDEEPTSKEGSAPDGNGNGHGSNGMPAAAASCQHLPALLDRELRSFYQVRPGGAGDGLLVMVGMVLCIGSAVRVRVVRWWQ